MSKKANLQFYYLGTCSTCARIMQELDIRKYPFRFQDIKTDPISPAQLDEMHTLAGSYEALFSRVALKYRALGLNTKKLSEKDYRRYILEEYTFLRRPVAIVGNQIFIGNAPSNIAALAAALQKI